MASKVANAVAGTSKYGKLWARGFESFSPKLRRVISVSGSGDHATTYLQGLVTSDLTSEPTPPSEEDSESINALSGLSTSTGKTGEPTEEEVPVRFTSKMRSTCFLDHRGRILTDAILWKRTIDKSGATINNNIGDSSEEEATNKPGNGAVTEYLIDVPGDTADLLFSHLKQHKLRRSKITLADKSNEFSVHAVYGTLNAEGAPPGFLAAMDPRHPSLGMRVLSVGPETAKLDTDDADGSDDKTNPTPAPSERDTRQKYFEKLMNNFFPHAPGTYSVLRKLAGIAEGTEITSRTALECNQEFLNAISFSKGCYLGQELTARSQFTGAVRKRIVPLMIVNTEMEVPRPWIMASMIQELGEEGGMERVFNLGGEEGEKKKIELKGKMPPPLPKMSASGAGGLVAMMMGTLSLPTPGNPQEGSDDQEVLKNQEEDLKKLRNAGEILQQEVAELAEPGVNIYDKQDSKTIGKIVSTIAPGTTVVLAQMRLDRLGLIGDKEKWSRMNKILIGESSKEYRYLPYLPLWWPDIDPATGKAKTEDKKEEDELDEL